MATTKTNSKKVAAKKAAPAKKSPAKKVAEKKFEKGKKLQTITFDVYEHGIEVNGEINIHTAHNLRNAINHVIGDLHHSAAEKLMSRLFGPKEEPAKKAPAKKK